ncbi:MAG: alpha/beta hydrolase [Luteimonas sp.]|nr:alpha/beta hydrolase [Luteimonas sp.]
MTTEFTTPLLIDACVGTTAAAALAQSQTSTTEASRFMTIDGGRIAYDDTGGDGRLILAIPGMGDLRSEYRMLRPALRRAGYRVVTMDLRGHGESSVRWKDYSAHAVGRDALALIAHLNADSAVILGTSFAAGSALWAAHDSPERVGGVVLLGPIVRDLDASAIAKLALKIGFAGPWRVWFWTTYWSSLFPKHKPVDHEQAKAAIARSMREPGRMDALQAMIALSKADTAAIISQSRVPALVVMGTRDPDFPDASAEARWLASQLHAETLIVEGAGHYPHTEMPEEVAPKLLSFIDGLRIEESGKSSMT